MASWSAGFSGCARSTPEISATNSGCDGLTVMLMAVSCGYSVETSHYPPGKPHAANDQARAARRLSEGSHAPGRLGPAEEARRRDHRLPRAFHFDRRRG